MKKPNIQQMKCSACHPLATDTLPLINSFVDHTVLCRRWQQSDTASVRRHPGIEEHNANLGRHAENFFSGAKRRSLCPQLQNRVGAYACRRFGAGCSGEFGCPVDPLAPVTSSNRGSNQNLVNARSHTQDHKPGTILYFHCVRPRARRPSRNSWKHLCLTLHSS